MEEMIIKKYDELKFLYEKKTAINALKRIPKDNITSKVIIEHFDRINSKIIVYDAISDEFYKISSKRFLEDNYNSVNKISKYNIRKRKGIEEVYPKECIFGLDDYKNKYPNNGFELLNCDDYLYELRYYINYKKCPYIKNFVKEGFIKFVLDLDDIDVSWILKESQQNKKTVSEILGLPEEVISVLKDEGDQKIHIDSIKLISKLYNKNMITAQQAKELLKQNYVMLYNLEYLLSKHSYTYDELNDYAERCRLHQSIPYNTVLKNLSSVVYDAKKYGIKVDKYPNDLKKEFNRINHIKNSFDIAIEKKNFYELYSGKDKNRKKLTFKTENYEIRPIEDVETYMQLFKTKKYSLDNPEHHSGIFAMLIDRKSDFILKVFEIKYWAIRMEMKTSSNRVKGFLKQYLNYLNTTGYIH